MTDESVLWIVAETVTATELTGAIEGPGPTRGGGRGEPVEELKTMITRRQRVSVDAQLLKAQMTSLLMVVNDLFSQAEAQAGLQLNEVELKVEINAEGQVSLVGTGGKLANTGGITLKFVRPPTA